MANKINLSEFKQEKIFKTIEYKSSVIEIYNPDEKQKLRLIEIAEQMDKIEDKVEFVVELIDMLTNISIGKNPKEVMASADDMLYDLVDILDGIMVDTYIKSLKRVYNENTKANEKIQAIKEILPNDESKEVFDKIINGVGEVEDKVSEISE